MGIFRLVQYRNGRKIGTRVVHNDHTNLSIKHLAYSCSSDSPIYPWNMDLDFSFIDDVGFTGIDVSDTATSHPGWSEYGGTRGNWARDITGSANPLPVASLAPQTIIFAADYDLRGIFIITRGETPELLMATALFAAVLSVKQNDILMLTYETAFQTPWP